MSTIFPREEKTEQIFDEILKNPHACERLKDTFFEAIPSAEESEGAGTDIPGTVFAAALFTAYENKDLSAFLMAICQNTLFDLLRNSFLIPYRFNADGKQNPTIMTDNKGALLPEYKNTIHEKEYRHFYEVYQDLGNQQNIYLAQAYCYSHSYASDEMDIEQQVIEENTGVLLIRELPDTVKLKETEAEAYYAVWDLMIELEKNLPMAYIFYGQDSLVEHNKRYDEIGIFLPNSIFLKNLEKHVAKAEEIIYAKK